MDTAIALITATQAELRKPEKAGVSLQTIDRSFVDGIDEDLRKVEPFSLLEGGWLLGGDGGGEPAHGRAGWWVLKMLMARREPADIVSEATAELKSNKATMLQISVVKGAKVDNIEQFDIEQFDDDLWLSPEAMVPESVDKERAFSVDTLGHRIRVDDCALIQRYVVSPALLKKADQAGIADANKQSMAAREKLEETRDLIRRAMVLAGSNPISMPSRFTVPASEQLLATSGGFYGSVEAGPVLESMRLDMELLREYRELLRMFPQRSSLDLAIDRLAKGRLAFDEVNKAIELGLALEVALMHNDKEAVSHKIGFRTGWLLGTEPVSRRAYKKRAGLLYSARSEAAHTGHISEKTRNQYSFQDANDLVREVLVNLLKRGKFPDWVDLLFAGGG